MNQTMEQAKTQLTELIEAARTGAIIPIRLTGQLEALLETLQQAETAARDQISAAASSVSGDADQVMQENAEFMKVAIHDLRTPMTSIRGYSDMLANPGIAGELNQMQDQLLQVVRSNSKRMETLLSDMSYINKLRAGILPVNNKMDMFKNIAQMAEQQARPIAEELNRQLEFDIPQGLPILTTDGDLFAHALLKLIENGLRYSAEGEGKVTVSARAEGSKLVVTIEDNGIGMTPEEFKRLGGLFFRADNDTVREHKGSGLGVYIAYGIVEALGGRAEAESEPGKGTRFTLRFEGSA
jgi:signal transduction histidine kinase